MFSSGRCGWCEHKFSDCQCLGPLRHSWLAKYAVISDLQYGAPREEKRVAKAQAIMDDMRNRKIWPYNYE